MVYILGIDPGSIKTGYGIVAYQAGHITYVSSGSIKLAGTFPQRLKDLHRALTEVISQHTIDLCAIESVFMSQNAQSALKLGQARGVCLLALVQQIGEPAEYAPRLVKKTLVGTGSATKAQVNFMIKQRLALVGDVSEDAADALAVAVCCIQHLQCPTFSHSR